MAQAVSDGERQFRSCVLEELERVCSGEAFRQSKQSARLLRYLVENTLDNHEERLRERAIGANLFGRDPKYDTNADSIVRVSAAEVRKRLARHYHEVAAPPEIQFGIPPGSYRVEFHRHESHPAPVARTPARRTWPLAAIGIPAAALLLAALIWFFRPPDALDRFWGPAVQEDQPVVLLAPHPILYTFSRETFRRFRGESPSHAQMQIEELTGPPDASIALKDVVKIRDQYIGLGSAHAMSSVVALLAVRGKPYVIRFGGDFSFQDIRHSPAVLVGAYANRWTLQLTGDYRFTPSQRGSVPEILDRKTGKFWPVSELRPDGRTPEDFAIVSRLFHPKTGKVVIGLAGITQYGTRAAGEFVTDRDQLTQALRTAAKGWERMNGQFVLHVPIVEGVPGQVDIVASHWW